MTREEYPPEESGSPEPEASQQETEGFSFSYIQTAAYALRRVRELAREAEPEEESTLFWSVSELIDCLHWKIEELYEDKASYIEFLARVLPEDENPVVREIGGNMLELHHENLIKGGFADAHPFDEAERWIHWYDREPDDYVRTTIYDHAVGMAGEVDGDVPQRVLDFAEAIEEAFRDRPRVVQH